MSGIVGYELPLTLVLFVIRILVYLDSPYDDFGSITLNTTIFVTFNFYILFLLSVGVYAGRDISYCSPEELDNLAAYLKAIPRRNFFKALGIERG